MNVSNFDVVKSWLDNVAYSHSGSRNTDDVYIRHLGRFCTFVQMSPDQILEEYENSVEKDFRRKYAQHVKAWISHLLRAGYAKSTIKTMVGSVKSFFKYSDLVLGYIPVGKAHTVDHNRDIKKEEITKIMSMVTQRDRAFYAVMAQSGLRPHTICLLRLKHVELYREAPAKIDVPQEIAKGEYHSHFSFIGPDALRMLKAYLATRQGLNGDSYLFSQHAKEEKLDRRVPSMRFRDAVLKLKAKGLIEYSQRAKGKAGTIRLYSLRKWFRKQAHQAGFELVQFWMGHTVIEGQEEHYRPQDVEFHRKLYAEKAMPNLRLEEPSPLEHEQIIQHQQEEIRTLRGRLKLLEKEFHSLRELIEKGME